MKVSKTILVVAPSTARQGPIPSMLMLASSVVFFPQLRGTEQYARSPRGDHARSTKREAFAPISSTKTNRWGSSLSETITLQAALRNSSRSSAPTPRFFG